MWEVSCCWEWWVIYAPFSSADILQFNLYARSVQWKQEDLIVLLLCVHKPHQNLNHIHSCDSPLTHLQPPQSHDLQLENSLLTECWILQKQVNLFKILFEKEQMILLREVILVKKHKAVFCLTDSGWLLHNFVKLMAHFWGTEKKVPRRYLLDWKTAHLRYNES